MRINTNISAMNTYSRLTAANTAKSGSLAKLSSGLRINKAGDDAAGLAISEKMRGQIGGLKQATRNAQDAISLIQTAEGGLNETHSILNRMRDLAVQSSNDTNTDDDRKEIQKEMNELSKEITRISKNTEFNTKGLLDGSLNATFHIGANKGQNLELKIENMSSSSLKVEGKAYTKTVGNLKVTSQDNERTVEFKLGEETAKTDLIVNTTKKDTIVTLASAADSAVGTSTAADIKAALEKEGFIVEYNGTEDGKTVQAAVVDKTTIDTLDKNASENIGIDVSSQAAADNAIETINDAIQTVSAERSKLGATQNRLDHTINNLTATAENLSEAESRIRDVDMAEEMMEFTKSNILSQAATSMLAQANQMPQGVLQLLQ